MRVVGVASTGGDAIRRADELRPDVTLLDVDLGEESGFDVARQLARAATGTPTPVILISAYPAQDLEDLIADSPAIGFIAKSDLSRVTIAQLLERSKSP